MSFSKFVIIVAIIYFTYYSINIIIDLIGKRGSSSHEESDVEFDVGEVSGPKRATLNDFDEDLVEPAGGIKQEFENQREEVANKIEHQPFQNLGIDLGLEASPPQIDAGIERLRKNSHHH